MKCQCIWISVNEVSMHPIFVNEVSLYASGSRDDLHSAIVDWETSTPIESSTYDERLSVDFASEDMI